MEQQKAIAEACGWDMIWESVAGLGVLFGRDPERKRALVPDYLNDLNAMHEAKMAVLFKDVDLYINYTVELEMVVGGDIDAHYATAAQEAEAFLRTLGLWKEKERATKISSCSPP